MDTDKVKVAVRVRPINSRELEFGSKVVVKMNENQTILLPVTQRQSDKPKPFTYDNCFCSIDRKDPGYADQEMVFNSVGKEILEKALEGYNGCIFAYGQTGSGKSYTMMGGSGSERGIIPRICDRLFSYVDQKIQEGVSCEVMVSYLEIYNEKVLDLLNPDPKKKKQNLQVKRREPVGSYVEGLNELAVQSFDDVNTLLTQGNSSRTVAATNMNRESSRSHAVFNIIIRQTLTNTQTGEQGEKVSKLSLVDLAGSERVDKTGVAGDRLKEGCKINLSLSTLGMVITELVAKKQHVSYRNSVLTYLLQDNLGGNSKTVMIATISPAADNHEETLSTLRYANRAKQIVNRAVINEDPTSKLISELRDEVERLRKELSIAKGRPRDGDLDVEEEDPEKQQQLQESEHLIMQITKPWEEKVAETGRLLQECDEAQKQMGVAVYSVNDPRNKTCPHLISLHADPQLNELLVIHLKGRKRLGTQDAPVMQDIQLEGLGILPEHALLDVEENDEVFITPLKGAKTCVNGLVLKERQKVKHGDRIVWGNDHFYKLHCPTSATSPQSPNGQQPQGYELAQQELMEHEQSDNAAIAEVIHALEEQYKEEKKRALEEQRELLEEKMQNLRSMLTSPGTPISSPNQLFSHQIFSSPRPSVSNEDMINTTIRQKFQDSMEERNQNLNLYLKRLKQELVKANSLVREANTLSQEMGKQTEFHVTLQIPTANLTYSGWKSTSTCEPAIRVKRKKRSDQIWTMEKMENKIVDMREMYTERHSRGLPMMVDDSSDDFDDGSSWDSGPPQVGDPFYESQENHILIGVANIFLECLLAEVTLNYKVPIISQKGSTAGKLHIEISATGNAVLQHMMSNKENQDEADLAKELPLLVRVRILEAEDLPPELSHFVFCQYSLWNQEPVTVAPDPDPDRPVKQEGGGPVKIIFNHEKSFRVLINDEFIELCRDGALSVEVWGNRSAGFGHRISVTDTAQAKNRSLSDKWNDVRRRVEMWVEIQEMNDQGEFTSVQLLPKPEVPCGGIFQLRQGHSRRVLVNIKPVANSGMLPLMCDEVVSMEMGGVTVRSSMFKGLDSYQEVDLEVLRNRWFDALTRRKKYLDKQIQKLINKQDKSEADCEREQALIDQWVCLTEEHNAVQVPSPGSNIPGAPAEWNPPPNVEEHSPVLFLDLHPDYLTTTNVKEGSLAAGVQSIVPKEQNSKFVRLSITKWLNETEKVGAVASWDSSMHDEASLNRVTSADERIYLVVKVVVRLKYPAQMELVLRKRVAINIYKKQGLSSFTSLLKNKIIGTEPLTSSGIIYEVISNLPKSSEDLEDLETLAQVAASENEVADDGEAYIEKYLHAVKGVDYIFFNDRLSQACIVEYMKGKKQLSAAGRANILRKATSLTCINQIPHSPTGTLQNQLKADSLHDITMADQLSQKSRSFPATSKQSPLSAGTVKAVKPMTTLMEEQHHRERKPLLHQESEEELEEEEESAPAHSKPHAARRLMEPDTQSIDSDDFQEFESYQTQQLKGPVSKETSGAPPAATVACTAITPSSTTDSLAEAPVKAYTSSMTSSGYGSQAHSTLTLSSDDSISVKSMEEPSDSTTTKGAAQANSLKRASTGTSTDSDPEDGHGGEDKAGALIEEDEAGEGEERRPGAVSSVEGMGGETDAHSDLTSEEISDRSQDKLVPHASQDTLVPEDVGDSSLCPGSPTQDLQLDSSANTSLLVPGIEVITPSSKSGSGSSVSMPEPDTDPYSEVAMEELERLGKEEDEERDISGVSPAPTSSSQSAPVLAPHKSPTSERAKSSKPAFDTSTPGDDNKGNRSKGGSGKKQGSGKRPRPVSMVVSPQAETMTRSWHEDIQRRSSLSLSDHALAAMDDNISECSFGSRADLNEVDSVVPDWVRLGGKVTVLSSKGPNKTGLVRFIGTTSFAPGNWIGVELDQAEGKNNGSVKGERYFDCREKHGIFVRPKNVEDCDRRKSRKGANPASRRSTAGLSTSLSNLSHSPASSSPSFAKPTSASAAKKK